MKNFVHRDEGFEGLHFIGENWLPALGLALPTCILIFHVFAKQAVARLIRIIWRISSFFFWRGNEVAPPRFHCAGLASSMSHRVGLQPTLSCPARSSGSSYDPRCTQCMLGHAFLRPGKLRSRGRGFGLERTFGRDFFDARGLADVDGELRFLPGSVSI